MSNHVPMTLEGARDLFERDIGKEHFKYEEFVKKHWGNHGLDCVILGLVGEAGEVADLRKKEYHGIPPSSKSGKSLIWSGNEHTLGPL